MLRCSIGTSVMSMPLMNTLPEVGTTSPAMTLRRVLLPEPLGPKITFRSPSSTSKDTLSRAVDEPYRFSISLTSRNVGIVVSTCSSALQFGQGLNQWPDTIETLCHPRFARSRQQSLGRNARHLGETREAFRLTSASLRKRLQKEGLGEVNGIADVLHVQSQDTVPKSLSNRPRTSPGHRLDAALELLCQFILPWGS